MKTSQSTKQKVEAKKLSNAGKNGISSLDTADKHVIVPEVITVLPPTNDGDGNIAAIQTGIPSETQKKSTITYSPRKGFDLLKPYAWRITGVYTWCHFVFNFCGFHSVFDQFESICINSTINFLAFIGFAPSSTTYFALLTKAAWVLIITGSRPLQLVYLSLYLIFFPLVVTALLSYYIYKKYSETDKNTQTDLTKDNAKSGKNTGLISNTRTGSANIFPFVLFSLVAWFIIFGDTASVRPTITGAVISFIAFSIFASKMIQRVIPAGNDKGVQFDWLRKLDRVMLSATLSSSQRINTGNKEKETIQNDLSIIRFTRFLSQNIALFCRSRSGRNIVSFIVLGEVVFNLLLGLLLAVVSWSLVVKSYSPSLISFKDAFYFTLPHFITAIKNPGLSIAIPTWIEVGSSLTGWFILVLYFAFSNSQVRDWQRANTTNLKSTYHLYRRSTLAIKRVMKRPEITLVMYNR